MKRLADENGQAMILSVLCMSCLLGFVALAADVGTMLHEKRILQIAADAAAIAGASEINYGDVTSAAQAAATANGFTDGTGGAKVVVNYAPLYGPYQGKAGYVEVIVSQSQPAIFMGLFGISAMTPTVRAVAQNGGSSNGCVYVLNATASDAMELQGSFDVSTPSCGIIVDSNSPSALDFTGAGGTLTAGSVGVVGGASGHTGDSTPAPVTGIVAESDPLAYVPPPTYNASSCTALPKTATVGPAVAGGVVCYGTGSSSSIAFNNVTLNPGVYVMNGNVSFSGTVTGSGVTLYLLDGLDASNGTLNLTAPTSGTYSGLLIFAARNNSSLLSFDKGNASGSLTGIIYAPDSEMELNDSGGDKNGGLSLTTNLIVNTLFDKTATLTITSYSQTVGTSPLTKISLVE